MTSTRETQVTDYWLLGNGTVALRFLEAMIARDLPPARLVLNAPAKQRLGDELRRVATSASIPVTTWSAEVPAELQRMHESGTPMPWLLSVYFGHILRAMALDAVGGRAINLHPSLLPWGRGAHTNVWPLIEGTPAGVTLHAMVPQVDAGTVLAQVEVPVQPWHTAQTLYMNLEAAALALLLDFWPHKAHATFPGHDQQGLGSHHLASELASMPVFTLDDKPEARAFFDFLRARSFPPHRGLLVQLDGRTVEATITLQPHDDA